MLGLGNSISAGSFNDNPTSSMWFDGTNDHLSGANVDLGTSDFSISMWINVDTIATSGLIGCTSSNGDKWLVLLGSAGVIALYFNATSKNSSTGLISAGDLNTWVHITVVSDRDVGYSFYKNGTLVNSVTNFDSSGINLNPSHGPLHIGKYLTFEYDGGIDEIGIWIGKVLGGDEILSIYNGGSPAELRTAIGDYSSQGDLTHYWKFEEGEGTTSADSKGSNTLTLVNGAEFSSDVP